MYGKTYGRQREELCAKGRMLVLLAGVIVVEERRVLGCRWESWGTGATGIVSESGKEWKQLQENKSVWM